MKLAYDVIYPAIENASNLPPIIMLHGFADARTTWYIVAPEIANATGRTVYSPDLRNHGNSSWSDEFDFDAMSNDLNQFVNEHNLYKFILVAHSASGRSAMEFAFRQPQRVEKLIVEDMTPKRLQAKSDNLIVKLVRSMRIIVEAIPSSVSHVYAKKQMFDLMLFEDLKDVSERLNTEMLRKNIHSEFLPIKKSRENYILNTNMDVLEKFLLSNKLEKELCGQYDGDALFLYGSKSFYGIETDDLIPKFFPKAIKQKIENSSHLCHIENPEDFIKYVTNFIVGDSMPLAKY